MGNTFRISVREQDFDAGQEVAAIRRLAGPNCGAITTFTGLVRASGDQQGVTAIELEHYPGMTESALGTLMNEARERWPLHAATIIHRVGRLELSEQIVFVCVASSHRLDAFEAAEFLMDTLKTRAPFWKKEHSPTGVNWVQAKDSDKAQHTRWQT